MDFDSQRRAAAAEGQRRAADRATATTSSSARAYAQEPTAGAASCGSSTPSSACSALPFAEEHGGFGGGPVETMIVMEAFGRALALEPYLATVVLGGGFLRHGGSDAQQGRAAPEDRGRRADCSPSRIPSGRRATISPTSRRRAQTRRRRLRARRREEPRAPRRQRRQADRLARASSGGQRDRRRHRRCFWSTPRRRACRGAAIRRMDGLRAAEVTLARRQGRRRRA